MCPWCGPFFNHDQVFKWNLPHYASGNIILIHKSHFMFQLCDAFVTHFSLHHFKVVIKGGCEVVVHDIKCTLNLHTDWVVLQLDMTNVFNSMLGGVIV
jgi:hypothetical protein